MKLSIPIRGITAEIRQRSIVIKSASPLKALNSSILNRSYGTFSAIVNTQIPEGYNHTDPKSFFLDTKKDLGLIGHALGLVTAVDVTNVAVVSSGYRELTVCAVVTAGVLNSASAGDKASQEIRPHTMNIIVLVDGNLTQHCMVNAVMTATEAKCAALGDLDIRSSLSAELATGTTSDMIAVACTGRGRSIRYAGTATKLGELIGSTVREAVRVAIKNQQDMTPNRPLSKRLEERGIKFDRLLDSALKLYIQDFDLKATEEMTLTLKSSLQNALLDMNISALVLAGLRLREDYVRALVPSRSAETREQNSASLKAGQILGKAIAGHMAEEKGIHVFLKFGKKNPGVLEKLEPIASEVLKGLFAGLSSEVLNNK